MEQEGARMGRDVHVLQRVELGCATVEIRESIFTNSSVEWLSVERGMLELSLSDRQPSAQVHYAGISGLVGGRPGKLIYLPASMPFEACWERGATRTLCCHFPGDMPQCGRVWSEAELSACLSIKNSRIIDLMLSLKAELVRPGPYGKILLEGICTEVAAMLGRHIAAVDSFSSPETRGLALQMQAILEKVDGRRGTPTLKEIAAELGYSSRHLVRVVQKITGLTYSEFLSNQRIALARDLLINSKLSIKEISYDLGYDSPNSFARAFRSTVGSLPTDYRRFAGGR